MSKPCKICGSPCLGKANHCSRQCQLAILRQNQRRYKDRQRGGPRLCKVCGKPIRDKTATNTCSEECWRANRLGVPLDRLPPLIERKAQETCDVCGAAFAPKVAGQKGCSPACMRAGRLRRKLAKGKKGPYPPRDCGVCKQEFAPKKKNQVLCGAADCAAAYKRRLENNRNRGVVKSGPVTIFCCVCGELARVNGNAIVCGKRACVLARKRQKGRERLAIEPCSCIVCGERFWPPEGKPGAHYTCSLRCKRIALSRKNRRTYENNREKRLDEQAERLRTDPEYAARRREVDREYRQRRRQRLAEVQMMQVATKLEEKATNERVSPHTCPDCL